MRDPRRCPDAPFTYVDISSVDRLTKTVIDARTILGRDAPSRARKVIKTNDVLVSTTRPNLNAVALIPGDLDGQIASTGFCVLRASERLDPGYLFAYVRSPAFVASLSDLVVGALYPAVTDRQVMEQTIPLPPLSEQTRIAAAVLEQLDAAARMRAATERQLRLAEASERAHLCSVWQGELSRSWPQRRLADVAVLERGKFTPRPRNDPRYYGGAYPWIQTGDVEVADKYVTKHSGTLNEQGRAVSRLFRAGTLVMTIAASIGAVGILGFDTCMPDSLVGVSPRSGEADTEFLYYTFLHVRSELVSLAPKTAQANLKLATLNPFPVRMPSLEVQRSVVQRLNAAFLRTRRLHGAAEAQAAEASCLTAALLRRAFSGGL